MVASNVRDIYERHIRSLELADRMRLVEMIVREVAGSSAAALAAPKHSIMELRGLGAEIWQGIDAQEYVNKLREEWDHRP